MIVSADSDEFLTVADIAEILKLNQQTVRNWIDQAKQPAASDAALERGRAGRQASQAAGGERRAEHSRAGRAGERRAGSDPAAPARDGGGGTRPANRAAPGHSLARDRRRRGVDRA